MDQRIDVFAEYSYGKIALQKIASPEPNFRLYYAGWMGKVNDRNVMKVTGAVFREPTRGPKKGQLSILVPKTQRTAYVTSEEMTAFAAAEAARIGRPTQPVDQTLILDLRERGEEIDWTRPLYQCQICLEQGEGNLHKYLDDCHYFDEDAFLAARSSQQ